MREPLASCALCFALLVGTAGCATPAERVDSPELEIPAPADTRRADIHGLQYVWSALEAEGLQVAESTSTVDSGVFGNDAQFYALAANEAQVRIYVPDVSHDTTSLASRVSSDGSSFEATAGPMVSVSWAGRPRFFRDSNVIVLYLEGETLVGKSQPQVSSSTDRKVMRALTNLLGEPFAGTP